jgi:CheY-like chemotaxis protein
MQAPASPRSSSCILVAENHDEIRRLILVVLQRDGYRTCEAADGKEALAVMLRGEADLVVLDLMMPGVSGWDVLTARAADPALRRVPVIVVSAVPEFDDAEAVRGGASAILRKPFDPVILQQMVASCLSQSSVPDATSPP